MLRVAARRMLSDWRPVDLHIPVMAAEVTDCLSPRPGQTVADLTFGAGGHSCALLARCPDLTVVAVDRDEEAIDRASDLAERLSPPSRLLPVRSRFSDLASALAGWPPLDAALMDLGASSPQLDAPRRGFSLSTDGPLDMRMDRANRITAAGVVNSLDARDLARVFKLYGEEKKARRIANAIEDRRFAIGPVRTTSELAAIVETAVGQSPRMDSLGRASHVATRVFQALRIFVNNELNELQCGLAAVHHLLRPGGVCAVIAFHSLEDRIVKQEFQGDFGRAWERLGGMMMATEAEVEGNPRARSAKMRVARKIGV